MANGGTYPWLHERKGKCKRKQEPNSSVTSCDEAFPQQLLIHLISNVKIDNQMWAQWKQLDVTLALGANELEI
jgi:hypothetical protein